MLYAGSAASRKPGLSQLPVGNAGSVLHNSQVSTNLGQGNLVEQNMSCWNKVVCVSGRNGINGYGVRVIPAVDTRTLTPT